MGVDRDAMVRDDRQIGIQMERAANRAMARLGLTAMQAKMLLYILDHSDRGTSLTEIHREFGYSMAALCGLAKRLREKGYIRVEPCAGDDRRKLLFGTGKGEQVREVLDRALMEIQDRLYDGFTQEELAAMDRLQKKMLRNLSAWRQCECKEVSDT